MAWQAVNRIAYSQAGGGGPQGVASRVGSAAPGFRVLTLLSLGVGEEDPAGTPAQYAAVRHALAVWQVNTVVVPTEPGAPVREQGRDPAFAAAFMTAALGRIPTVQAGAWVWDDLRRDTNPPLLVHPGALETCANRASGRPRDVVATGSVTTCVASAAAAAG